VLPRERRAASARAAQRMRESATAHMLLFKRSALPMRAVIMRSY